MNALGAFRDGVPAGPQGEGLATDAGDRPQGGRAHLPVIVPPLPASLAADDGTRLVAGLTWETASGLEAPVLRADAPSVLRLPDRRARLVGVKDEPCGSLLLAMAAGLARLAPGVSGPWAFIAEIPEPDDVPLLWMAVADVATTEDDGDGETAARVTPRPGPEGTFDEADEALSALQEHLSVTDVAGIAVRWTPVRPGMVAEDTFRGPFIQGLARIAPDVPLHDVEPAAGTPVFVPPRRVPVRLVGALGAGVAALLAGFLFVVPAVQALFETPLPPPPEMVAVAIPTGAFASACTQALDAWWPRVIGWRTEASGCALSGHLPRKPALPEPQATDLLARPMTVWRHLVPENGRNAVMGKAAAEQMIGTWTGEARLDEGDLTLWRTASLPLAPAETTGEGMPLLDSDAIRSRLAALWADAPDAVTRGGQDADGDLFTISAPAAETASAILARAEAVPGIAPVRLVQLAAGGTELVLARAAFREVPAAFLGSTEGVTSE